MMSLVEKIGLKALHQFDPEQAHGLALKALQYGFGPKDGPYSTERLKTHVAGLDLPNPIGLAAGFDKNATVLAPLAKCGFGFVEVGAVTPRPQPGNPKPRLFRLTEDNAAINRFGFNNDGMDAAAIRLSKRPKGPIVGLNLGANKDSSDRASDFAKVLARCAEHLDFATVNVSSPNTEKLRDLQGKEALSALLAGVVDTNASLDRPLPIFLKIAPDLTDLELEIEEIAEVANTSGISGIIATNTTLDRSGLQSVHAGETGGLSGQPLFEKSTRVLAKLSLQTHLPIIGVGGVATADQAYEKIRAGASAVQLYTALVFGGIGMVDKITRGLDAHLARDGFESVAQAVGSGRNSWL